MIKPQMRKTATLLSLMIAISILSVCCHQLTTTSTSEAESATPINSRDYCPAIHALIKNAKSNIRIMAYQTFFYTDFPDSDSNLFIKELGEARKRGVQVWVLLETSNWDENVEAQNKEYGKRLEAEGVTVFFDKFDITSHQKVAIVDDYATVVASNNWSHYSLWQNNEVAVIAWSAPVAKAFSDYMNERLIEAGHQPLPPTSAVKKVDAKKLGYKTYPAQQMIPIPNREYFPKVHEAFQNAQKRIRVLQRTAQYYTILPSYSQKELKPGEPVSQMNTLLKDLIEAKKRNVDVQVVLDAEMRKRKSTGDWKVDTANEDFAMRLLAGDVAVFYDSLETQTHAKMVMVDDWVVVGSTNWTHNAIEQGNEASIMIQSKELAQVYYQYFEDRKKEGIPVTPETDLNAMKNKMEQEDKQ